ncbi:MAG: hypothetical protein AB1916_16625, partial [Thermodesulfobacteriota bacterium]
ASHLLGYDQAGSLKAVAAMDGPQEGRVVKVVDYDAFGQILSDSNPALFMPLALFPHSPALPRRPPMGVRPVFPRGGVLDRVPARRKRQCSWGSTLGAPTPTRWWWGCRGRRGRRG